MPSILYKYRCWESDQQKNFLLKNDIYLASADQFNDPFDATIPFRYSEEEMTPENIFIKLLETGRQNNPGISEEELHKVCYERQNSGAFDNGQYWKDDYERQKQETYEKFGILSLTTKNDNLLMWSHYTNSYYGFCIGFDTKILYDTIQGQLTDVKYSDTFPEIGLFDDPVIGLTKVLTTKSKEWAYEEEYRITKIEASRKVFNFPNEAVKEIILGIKMKHEDKLAIIDIAKKFPDVKIFEAAPSQDKFKLIIAPLLLK